VSTMGAVGRPSHSSRMDYGVRDRLARLEATNRRASEIRGPMFAGVEAARGMTLLLVIRVAQLVALLSLVKFISKVLGQKNIQHTSTHFSK
jgi:hypothetical protein